jgi:hypothetical protein
MNIIVAFIPIILVIFVLYWVFFIVLRTGKKYVTVKVTHWMVLIYLILLLVSSAVVPFISEDITVKKTIDENESYLLMDEMYANIRKGNLDKIDPNYLIKKEQFKISDNKPINIVSNNEYGPQVYIEKEQRKDVEVFIYAQELLIEGLDFSEKRIPHEIKLKDNNLIISPIRQNLKISLASNPFPVRQFTYESLFKHGFSSSDQIIYIKAPEDTKFTSDEQIILDWVN